MDTGQLQEAFLSVGEERAEITEPRTWEVALLEKCHFRGAAGSPGLPLLEALEALTLEPGGKKTSSCQPQPWAHLPDHAARRGIQHRDRVRGRGHQQMARGSGAKADGHSRVQAATGQVQGTDINLQQLGESSKQLPGRASRQSWHSRRQSTGGEQPQAPTHRTPACLWLTRSVSMS